MVTITTRPTTVSAHIGADDKGEVEARSGASLPLAGMAKDEGMTPLELMDAALSGCLVLSVRIAARTFGWRDRLKGVSVDVTHEKGDGEPSRVAKFLCAFDIKGTFNAQEREQLIQQAHAICTVGHTLERGAEIVDIEKA